MSMNCLMFADDILLLSETPEGLQNSINKLNYYCNKWQLTINTQKTKIMVIQEKIFYMINIIFTLMMTN